MVIANNCILQSTDYQIIPWNNMKKVLSKTVFPDLYKLLWVALTILINS